MFLPLTFNSAMPNPCLGLGFERGSVGSNVDDNEVA